jgi:hypothetical protein
MASTGTSGRPGKRKREGRKMKPIAEDDDAALDTAMYVGNSGHRVLVPVRFDDEVAPSNEGRTEPEPEPEPEPDFDMNPPPSEMLEGTSRHGQSKGRWFYMKEFVSRVDGILQAMQAREALPSSGACVECPGLMGKWRCRDCMDGGLLCRCCIRKAHWGNPFHRVEYWTGTHFRKAALWEAGVYISLKHQDAPNICPNLQWQHQILEIFQKQKDAVDNMQNSTLSSNPISEPDAYICEPEPEHEPDFEAEKARDAATMGILDQMLGGGDPNNFMEEEDDMEEDPEADLLDSEAGGTGFTTYMSNDKTHTGPDSFTTYMSNDKTHTGPDSSRLGPAPETPIRPERDALNNGYVRVVHTNGIHYIALVSCTCRGKEKTLTDLIYAGMLPTSFVRVRTLFTTALLDHFRYCNLELRTTAYQFFQVLRRFTMPMAPLKVANLYHELRRLSRLWRWVKKLRWAGYAQHPGQPIVPEPGELGCLCPACPQDGINIPENWIEDPNRWVFRRVFTGDGNFTADHVRQKAPADDMWLYDGQGMTARRAEYKEFLATAWERATVRNPEPESG